MTSILAIFLALIFLAIVRHQRKRKAYIADLKKGLTDASIEEIIQHGTTELDEPLDLQHIREEEERFWEESAWDEPESLISDYY